MDTTARPGVPGVATTVALALALLTGCAGNPPAEEADGPRRATLIVDNTGTSASDVEIYVVPRIGVRNRVGSVGLEEVDTLTIQGVDWGNEHRLFADVLGGGEVLSRRFTLAPGVVIEWDLDLNTVAVLEGG